MISSYMAKARKRTRRLFERFVKYGVTINLKKCLFEETTMDFLGHHITGEGIRPLTSRMAAIKDFHQPKNIKELRRFMGMANQMSKFNPDLEAEASAPLRSLMSGKNQWLWTTEQAGWQDGKSRQECPIQVQPFWDSRHDLTMINGLMLKGCRIVISKSLQRDVLDKLHNAHQGMDRTKRRARQSLLLA